MRRSQSKPYLSSLTLALTIVHIRYFLRMLTIFSSSPFYPAAVELPSGATPISSYIKDNPKFWPFFKDALGAIDGTHIRATIPVAEQQVARDRKGLVTQNCLAACSFNLKFVYMFSGWEGSTSDSTMYNEARIQDLAILKGKYYLVDAGFPTCEELLLPYRGVHYHLSKWGHASVR